MNVCLEETVSFSSYASSDCLDQFPQPQSIDPHRLTGLQSLVCTFRKHALPLLFLTTLTFLLYGANLDSLSIRGEESRRGRTAWEMLEYNNWIVPTLQGQPRLTRPPFSYWMIALVGKWHGQVDVWALRIPSLFAVLVAAISLYIYGSSVSSMLLGFLAAFCFLTMGQVLQLGRLGETEAVFAALMGIALLTAHASLRMASRPACVFSLKFLLASFSGVVAGMAMLTKGLQAPIYYFGTIIVYSVTLFLIQHHSNLTPQFSLKLVPLKPQQWSTLRIFTVCSLFFVLSITAWFIPFAQRLGYQGLHDVVLSEISKHVSQVSTKQHLAHFFEFPFELFFACLCPWSLLLLSIADPRFRHSFMDDSPLNKNKLDIALFALVGFLVALPTIWLPPDGNTRYMMPVYPLVAILAAMTTQQIIERPALLFLWQRFSIVIIALMSVGIVLTASLICLDLAHRESLSIVAAMMLFLGPVLLYYFCRHSFKLPASAQPQVRVMKQIVLMSVYAVLLCNFTFLKILNDRRIPAQEEVAQLKSRLPQPYQLVSLGLTHHLFTFHYAQRLPMLPAPHDPHLADADFEYFCFHHQGADNPLPEFPFSWTLISTINCDRKQKPVPYDLVLVGRRVPDSYENSPSPQLAYEDSAHWLDPQLLPIQIAHSQTQTILK